MATPTWGNKPCHLSSTMNQAGKSQGTSRDQAMNDSLPELMNQGGSSKGHDNPMLKAKTPRMLKQLMGQ